LPCAGVLLADGLAELDVDEVHDAALLGEDGRAVRVPLDEDLAALDLLAGLDVDLGAVVDLVFSSSRPLSSRIAISPFRLRLTRQSLPSSSSTATSLQSRNSTVPPLRARYSVSETERVPTPPVWNVRMVSWVPGSPIDWAAMMPTARPSSTRRPVDMSMP
jgi:hypothetical protein